MIERSHLEILRQVGRQRTLTEAADALHLSQSALSHAIRKLESQVQVKIWTRQGRRLELTGAGQLLHELATRILPQFEYAETALARFSAGKKGILRIGMECHPCYKWLLNIVLPYLEQWPEVDMDIKKDLQFDGIGALRNHEIDLLITSDPIDDEALQFTAVFDYEMVLVVGRKHHLADRDHVLPVDLTSEKLFTYPVAKDRLDIFTNFLSPANCQPAAHQPIEDTEIMIQMTAAGRGITALPYWLIQNYVETLPVRALRLGQSGVHKKLFTGVRKQDLATDFISSFIQQARNAG